MRERLIRQDRLKSFRWQVSSRISINQDGRLIEIVSDFWLSLATYTSRVLNARFISSGVAVFHCCMVFAGKISASFAAKGQDTGLFPFRNKLMVDLWYPNSFIFLSVFLFIARLYRGNSEMSRTFFADCKLFLFVASKHLY